MGTSYRVTLTKDHLVFSAGHFITFAGGQCERLHGHNWRVAAEIIGALDENAYVYDFIALRDQLQHLVQQLDHRMLLPTQHPQIHVTEENREVIARFAEKRWVFPREDCCLLPVPNTTAEQLARWIGEQLWQGLDALPDVSELRVGVEENFGQWGWWEYRRSPCG